ncbi:MAG: hypothetical protein KDM63_00200 [Verrucomicrobiae bacterium]|nr:hypothetical protein [Verrucomicrobiae bacterium]MCB1089892.1 hypothetical protein [Verrucomicrobiae bacterium]
MDTLHLILPDASPDCSVTGGDALPFALWTVVDQPLLHHWFDHAIDHDFGRVVIECPRSIRPAIEAAVREATLWPIEIALVAEGGETGGLRHLVDKLPTDSPDHRIPLDSVEDMLARHAELSRRRLDHIWAHLQPDFPFLVQGKGAYVHPDAVLVEPYWIGDQAEVDAGAVVGPYAVVGAGVRVRSGVELIDTHIGEGADLMEGLTFDGHTVARGLVFNHRKRLLHRSIDPALVRFRKVI